MFKTKIEVVDMVDPATAATIETGLDRHNEAVIGPDTSRPGWAIARDEECKIAGGVKVVSIWDGLLIDWLWVAEDARRKGLGSKLMLAAEDLGRARNCTFAFLNTFSFQAPDFYEKLGYTEFGRLEEFPAGHARFWLRKSLLLDRCA